MKCEHCERTIPGHYWGKIRAHDAGWFFSKDGHVYCPDHAPEWVDEWRARRRDKRGQRGEHQGD